MDTQRLAQNWLSFPKNFSTWVVAAISFAASYWLSLSPADQAALLAAYPWIKTVAPSVSFVTFMAARLWPQGAPAGEIQATPMTAEQAAKLLAVLGQASKAVEK